MTYVYADSTAVLGPLSPTVEPHSYDMCESHSARLTAPRGWELIRIETEIDPVRVSADMEALANVVRESALREPATTASAPRSPESPESRESPEELADAIGEGVQRGHLRSVPGVLPGMDY